jgi:hypothetical protein
MKNYFLISVLFLAFIAKATAQPKEHHVSQHQALIVAGNFLHERTFDKGESFSLKVREIVPVFKNAHANYYAINFEEGFVLIAGIANVWPVLAYSTEGHFSLPENETNVKAWLDQYEKQIEHAVKINAQPTKEIKAAWDKYSNENFSSGKPTVTEGVAPLLTSKWNQGIYYNELCPPDPAGPGGRTYAGCVATAMGQVMYYFRYPQTGAGSYSYYHPDYDTISANFENTTYKWNEMVNQLAGSNTAVAELLFHLGVSVDMVYGPNGSGMYNHKAAYALRTHFKYAPETQYVFRDSTTMDWDSLLVTHLNQRIPMYYAGWSQPHIYGHAFVVDGYQGEGFYHFNWGWGGSFDGYFYTNELTPGGSNFNLAQELIINCYPDTINHAYPDYCAGQTDLTHHEGTFDDGSGPVFDYAPDSQCSFLINPQNEMDSITSITLSFQRFELEPDDYFSVFDGEDNSAPLIGTFTGDSIPDQIISTGNELFMLFHSNPRGSAAGFFASYSSQKPVWCSGMTELNAPEGWLSDGSENFFYNNGITCLWYLNPESASEITLNFTKFDTEPDHDVVKIFDPDSNTLLAEFSGYYSPDSLPPPVVSASGAMFITFTTNRYVRATGWEAFYSSIPTAITKPDTDAGIAVFPNPAAEAVHISWKNYKTTPGSLTLLNSMGQIIKTFTIKPGHKSCEIDISGYPAGLYFVRLQTSTNIFISKMIKE